MTRKWRHCWGLRTNHGWFSILCGSSQYNSSGSSYSSDSQFVCGRIYANQIQIVFYAVWFYTIPNVKQFMWFDFKQLQILLIKSYAIYIVQFYAISNIMRSILFNFMWFQILCDPRRFKFMQFQMLYNLCGLISYYYKSYAIYAAWFYAIPSF